MVKFDDGKKEERVVIGTVGSGVFATRADQPGALKIEAGQVRRGHQEARRHSVSARLKSRPTDFGKIWGVTRAAIALVAVLAASACGASRTVAVTPAASPTTRTPVQQLQADLSAIFETPQFERSFWSVLVRPAASGDDLYSLNAGKLVMPGSNMKIVTLAAAAELLGWDYRFETKVVSVAPVDQGVLRGDLVVIGGGDPSISERSDVPGALRALARQVRDAGITRIEGGIIGDDDLFDDNGFGDGWTLDNLPYGYSAAVSALEYNEGSVDLVIRAGAAAGDPVTIQVRPGRQRLADRQPTCDGCGVGARHADPAAAAGLIARRRERPDSGEGRAVCAHSIGRQPHGVFSYRRSAMR